MCHIVQYIVLYKASEWSGIVEKRYSIQHYKATFKLMIINELIIDDERKPTCIRGSTLIVDLLSAINV